jgi:hypothetical protein
MPVVRVMDELGQDQKYGSLRAVALRRDDQDSFAFAFAFAFAFRPQALSTVPSHDVPAAAGPPQLSRYPSIQHEGASQ